MKRSSFKRQERVHVRTFPTINPTDNRFRLMRAVSDDVVSCPKENVMHHEGYRRLVSLMACKLCGIVGYTQVAHSNYGKGMAIKADDRMCFPLCGDRPGVLGCHTKLDRGLLFTQAVRREVEQAWAADTRRAIEAAGNWPADLPKWREAA